jgi:transporter family-2 protein
MLGATLLATIFGALLAVQARVNGELGERLDDGLLAAFLSFIASLLTVLVALPFWRPGWTGVATLLRALAARRIPWWHLAGGVAAAVIVASQSLTAALLGVALFTVAIVSGQTIGGLVIDRTGFGSMPATRITPPRLVGSLLALVAVAVAVSPQLQGDVPLWMLVLPFIAGLGAGFQTAANGQVREFSGSVHTVTLASSLSGSVVLAAVVAVKLAITGPPPAPPLDWWLYSGGVLGVLFVAGAAVLVRFTGVLVLGLGLIAGQLLGSLLLDILLPVGDEPVHPITIVGTLLTLVAVVVAGIPAKAKARQLPGVARTRR